MPRILTRGVKPNSLALSADIINIADAPSDIADEVPAVTVPLTGSKTGRSVDRLSAVVSGRITSSSSTNVNAPSAS